MITVLTGSNSFLLKAELKKLVDEFVQKYTDMAVERFDGEEVSLATITGAVQSMPFLVEKKLVVLRNAANNKDIAEKIDELLAAVTDTTDLAIVEDKLDKRSVYYKTLKKDTEFKEFNELDERGLAQWLVGRAKEQGGSLSLGDATYLVQRIGPRQMLLASELEKLLIYEPKITRQTIDLLTEPTPQSTIFELLDAAFAGNRKQAMQIYEDQRKQKVEPQQILAMLAWQLHVLALIKTAGQRTPDQIASEAKISPFVVRKSQNITRKLTMAELKDLIARALALDISLKRQSIDADDALQHYLLTLT